MFAFEVPAYTYIALIVDKLWTLWFKSKYQACLPLAPAGPVSPGDPGGPVWPFCPLAPSTPLAPFKPGSPFCPSTTVVSPVVPLSPLSPWAPYKMTTKTHINMVLISMRSDKGDGMLLLCYWQKDQFLKEKLFRPQTKRPCNLRRKNTLKLNPPPPDL